MKHYQNICNTIADCGQPNNTANGNFSVLNGTTYGAKATYTCNIGYNMTGSAVLACGMNGWNASAPVCSVHGMMYTVSKHLYICTVFRIYTNCFLLTQPLKNLTIDIRNSQKDTL